MKTKQFCPQRKPEEETHQGDNEAKKSKPEPAVNGGGAAAAPSGKEVAEKMEEEVGSRVRTWCLVFFFVSRSVKEWFCAWLVLLPAGLHRVSCTRGSVPSCWAARCAVVSDTK